MADDVDRTTERMLFEMEQITKRPQVEPEYGPEECEECGNEMPELRREYGFKLCVGCQEHLEQLEKRRRR